MKKLLTAALLALPLLALPSSARANGFVLAIPGCPFKVEAGLNAHLRIQDGCCGPQAGPWYLYWPLEAHFGPPAPTGFPFWPSHMTLPPDNHAHAPYPAMIPGNAPAPPPTAQPGPVSPVGYQTSSPNYWYK